ncbi:MAG: ATP-binding protein [Anaerolineae bacterium]|nr:ATP-binding protein [Anaerolineae bacterium]
MSLRLPARLESIDQIIDFITVAAQQAGLDEQGIYAVQLATDEACANVIEHAYVDMEPGEIVCSCAVVAGALTVTIRDFGRAFDPECIPDPDLEACLDDRPVGGLGLYFMRSVMDEVQVISAPGQGNVVILVKRGTQHGRGV